MAGVMSVTDDHRAPLADGLVRGLVDVHLAAGGPAELVPGLTRVLSALFEACADGHVGLSLAADSPGDTRAVLAGTPLVTQDAASMAPLVLDNGVLYRRRDWLAERALADGLLALAEAPARAVSAVPDQTLNARQRAAVAVGLTRRLLVLSGGPGTGKTHALAALVHAVRSASPGATIALAAPTGKAAARLADALRAGGAESAIQVGTVHRLLGARPDGRFARGSLNPVDADWVIVDECSMLDSRLAAHLVSSLAAGCTLVLAGDHAQLASVQAGAFFGAVCQARRSALVDCRVLLEENFRQREVPSLIAFAAGVLAGGLPPLESATPGPGAYAAKNQGVVGMVPAGETAREHEHWSAAVIDRLVDAAAKAFEPLVGAARSAQDDDARLAALRAFAGVRVLAALRTGPAGVFALNRRIVGRLFCTDAMPQIGRLIVIRRNLPALGLFNGDIGMVTREDAGGEVMFESGRTESFARLGSWEDAFALTIHQAQGSEFERVLLLPAPADHRMATREALYTGATRARRSLLVFADTASLSVAAATPGREQQSLLARLNGEAA